MWQRLQAVGASGDYVPELIVYHHIPEKRLQKTYFRQWVRNDARNRGKMWRKAPPQQAGRPILGAPTWMWRAAATAALRACGLGGRADEADRFKAELDVIEFAGFFSGRNLPWLADKYIDRA
jgi:hypothetical protein